MNLTAALKALHHGDLNETLDRLLTLWRITPFPHLADAIDAVDRAIVVAPTTSWWPITATSKLSPIEVTERLRTLTRDASGPELTERISSLVFVPQDPRVATRLIALLKAPLFTASSHKALWRSVFVHLRSTHKDPRSEALLQALAPDYTRIFGDTVMGRWMASEIVKTHFAIDAHYPKQHPARAPLAASDEAALQGILDTVKPAVPVVEAAPVDPEAALWQSIAESPRDESRREAWRQWIIATDDPRRPFVALQHKRAAQQGALSETDEADEARLQKRLLSTLLGPLAPIVLDPVFVGGFLHAGVLVPKGTKTAAALGDARWSTVEKLEVGSQKNYGRDLVLHPMMKSLREIPNAPDDLVATLLTDPTQRPLWHLHCEHGPQPGLLPSTVAAPGLPALKRFGISCWFKSDSKYTATWQSPTVFVPFLQSPLAARLEKLRWDIHDSFITDLQDTLNAHAPATFAAEVDAFHARFARGFDGRWSDLTLASTADEDPVKHLNASMRIVRRLDPSAVTRVTIEATPGVDHASLLGELDALRAHFAKSEVRLLDTASA